jgi:hypothetical protein
VDLDLGGQPLVLGIDQLRILERQPSDDFSVEEKIRGHDGERSKAA